MMKSSLKIFAIIILILSQILIFVFKVNFVKRSTEKYENGLIRKDEWVLDTLFADISFKIVTSIIGIVTVIIFLPLVTSLVRKIRVKIL